MRIIQQLSSLSINSVPEDQAVATDGNEILTWRQFSQDILSSIATMRDLTEDAWALYDEDSYSFAVALFALLSLNKTVYLPASDNNASKRSLEKYGVRFLSDSSVSGMHRQSPPAEPPSSFKLTGHIVIFTSGSTGHAKAIEKKLGQLDAEIETLEKLWGEQLHDAVILATVSHQHFYGLLFRVLWPICSGRIFRRRAHIDPTSLPSASTTHEQVAWIMSPAHLHRLDFKRMPQAPEGLRAVFSSGGPLKYDAAQAFRSTMGLYPIEVLGSSETGGIAWRAQSTEDALWRAFPGLELKSNEDGALVLRSPFLPDNKSYVTADAIELVDIDRFRLLSRLDRIVKIEGKRVSLPEVEKHLENHPWISHSTVLVTRRHRDMLSALIVLTPEGQDHHQTLGPRKFSRSLRNHLCQWLEPIAIPRLWRYTSQIPVNTQGKVLLDDVRRFFDSESSTPLPTIIANDKTEHGRALTLLVAPDCPFFDGHFPEHPVLPGVVQVHWADYYARKYLGLCKSFKSMRALKFKKIIRPDLEVTLSLSYDPLKNRLSFVYSSKLGEHSQGQLSYEPRT